jgi:hypothetical protein
MIMEPDGTSLWVKVKGFVLNRPNSSDRNPAQGDPIGRILAFGHFFSFGRFLKMTEVSHILGNFFLTDGLDYSLGDFFTNSSGKPAHH